MALILEKKMKIVLAIALFLCFRLVFLTVGLSEGAIKIVLISVSSLVTRRFKSIQNRRPPLQEAPRMFLLYHLQQSP